MPPEKLAIVEGLLRQSQNFANSKNPLAERLAATGTPSAFLIAANGGSIPMRGDMDPQLTASKEQLIASACGMQSSSGPGMHFGVQGVGGGCQCCRNGNKCGGGGGVGGGASTPVLVVGSRELTQACRAEGRECSGLSGLNRGAGGLAMLYGPAMIELTSVGHTREASSP